MEKVNFKKWEITAVVLALTMVIGIMLSFYFHNQEGFGLALIFSTWLFVIFVSTRINFDNRRLWGGLTFVVPYITIPIMLLRSYDNVKKGEQKNWKKAIDNIQQMIEKHLTLIKKSTMSSMLQAGNISREIIDTSNYWQPLGALVLDRNRKINTRIKGIEILTEINDNELVSELISKLESDSNKQIRDTVKHLKLKND